MRITPYFPVLWAAAMCFGLASAVFAEPDRRYRDGLAAYRTGNYLGARRHWRQSAEEGNTNAQAALGFLYLSGPADIRDETLARHWYGRAAARGQVDALYMLGNLYLKNRDAPPDYLRAYILCEMAVQRGEARGLPCRESAEPRLSKPERDRAQRILGHSDEIFELGLPGQQMAP